MGIILGFFICIFSFALWVNDGAGATSGEWGQGTPTVRSQNHTSFRWTPYCPTYYQPEVVKGVTGRIPVCEFGGNVVRMGMTYPDDGSIALVVGGLAGGDMYRVEGVCERMRNCVYAPHTDTLIARYYTPNGLISARVFTHVTQRVTGMLDPVTGEYKYRFDSSHPDFSFTDETGQPLAVEAVAASDNGKWVGIEYRNYGIILVNQETFEMRRVLAPGFRYDYSVDPTVEMAISNDGKTVAVMGERTGFMLARITPACGDQVRAGMGLLFNDDVVRCPLVHLDVASLIDRFHAAYDPYFNGSGDRLDFIAFSQTGEAKRVSAEAAGAGAVSSLAYLALGDSFTSGEGETDSRYYLAGTDVEYEKCHVSRRAYSFVLARLKGMSDVRTVACSGAKMTDIIHPPPYWGQGKRLREGGRGLSEQEALQEQASALESFHPGIIPQSDFVDRYQPELVTVGVGGNDAGLTTKARVCAMPGECEWTSDIGRHKTAGEIGGLFGRIVNFYRMITALSPLSQVVAIGYPLAIDENGTCDALTSVLFSASERRFMNESVAYLNEVIRQAARTAGVGFVDVSRVFEGHQVCGGSLTPAMNGLRWGDDAPLGSLLSLNIIGNESFHPTPFGHELVAAEVGRSDEFSNARTPCGNCSVPPASEYWGEGLEKIRLRMEDFLSDTELESQDSAVAVKLPQKSFRPGTIVRIEIHSDPTEVGMLKVREDGSVEGEVTLPSQLVPGVHTVHIFGTSFFSEESELYQELIYDPPDERATQSVDRAEKPSEPTLSFDFTARQSPDPNQREAVGSKESAVLGASIHRPAIERVSWSAVIIGGLIFVGIAAIVFLIVKLRRRNPP